MSEAEWRPVLGYEGLYEVSSLGEVRSLPRHDTIKDRSLKPVGRTRPGRLLKLFPMKGYLKVGLYFAPYAAKQKFVHVLVCEAFHGPRPPGLVAAHWDGDKTNNTPGNLRWATQEENIADNYRQGNIRFGEANMAARITAKDAAAIRAIRAARWVPYRKIAEMFECSVDIVATVVRGETWN